MIKSLVMPVLKQAARPYVAGDELDDAIGIAETATAHGYGVTICYWQADDETVRAVEEHGQVLLRYADADGNVSAESNPNGSVNSIAGLLNERGNVLGLMPHPEKACEELIGGTDGNVLFESMVRSVAAVAG